MQTGITLDTSELKSRAFKISLTRDNQEVGRAFLFLISNDLNDKPYGLLEDVFVEENYRGQGLGTDLVNAVIAKAKEIGCYKLIATSRHARPKVHELYERIGFIDHGKEFRMDF